MARDAEDVTGLVLVSCLGQVALIFLSVLGRGCLGVCSALTRLFTALGEGTRLCACSLQSVRCSMESTNPGLKLRAVVQQCYLQSNVLQSEEASRLLLIFSLSYRKQTKKELKSDQKKNIFDFFL